MAETLKRKFPTTGGPGSQRLAWLLILGAIIAAAAYFQYKETSKTATQKTVPPGPPIHSGPPSPTTPAAPVPQPPASQASPQATPKPAQPKPKPAPAPAQPKPPEKISNATTPKAYRKDAAQHLYEKNASRIYKGKLQPLLYAIGVLQVSIDKNGKVRSLHWMRAPRHAPEVIREIERTVRAAAPYPAPTKMNGVVYTDTWLWDKSGNFQLDTLTEGQL